MCYNTQSSLIAWVLANSIALFLFYRNRNYDRWNAGFIATFSMIQLLEGGIWATKNKEINTLLTQLILIVLLMQPLIQSYLGWKYTQKNTLYFLTMIYLVILMYGIFRIYSKGSEFYTKPGDGGHLIWHADKGSFMGSWLIGGLYLLGLFVPLLFAKNGKGIPLLVIGILTALYSLMIAKKGEFSSLWCNYAVIYAVVAVIV